MSDELDFARLESADLQKRVVLALRQRKEALLNEVELMMKEAGRLIENARGPVIKEVKIKSEEVKGIVTNAGSRRKENQDVNKIVVSLNGIYNFLGGG